MTNPSATKNHCNPKPIIDLASAYWQSSTLFAAIRLNIFGSIGDDTLSLDEVAQRLDSPTRILEMLLNALVSLDLIDKSEKKYSLPLASKQFLHPDSPASLAKAIEFNMYNYAVWDQLADAVKSGEAPEAERFHLGDDPEKTRKFVYSMHHRCLGMGREVAERLDLSDSQKLLDVGGGPGTYSMLLLKKFPNLSSVVIDLPPIAAIGTEIVKAEGGKDVLDRFAYHPGSYRDVEFPGEKDTVLLFGMMHQETPEVCRKLLKKAYDALQPGGRVAVLDLMLDKDKTSPAFSTLFAITMALTHSSGWVFSRDELIQWMHEVGFENENTIELSELMPHELMVAYKPK